LAGQVGAALSSSSAHQLEQGIRPQGGGIVLVGITADDLEHPLTHQLQQAVLHWPAPPLRNTAGQTGAQPEVLIGFRQPRQSAVTGQPPRIEGGS
jgi:hypothetical protein